MAERLDGKAFWAGLSAADREAIGAMAIEMVVAIVGQDQATTYAEERPFREAYDKLAAVLEETVAALLPHGYFEGALPPVPSVLGQVCRRCGCSEDDPCNSVTDGPCRWVEDDLCSYCAPERQ